MNRSRKLLVGSLLFLGLSQSGCISPIRTCTGCKYRMSTVSGAPTSNIDTATLEVSVKHSGACPQRGFPSDCTEVLTYDVKCALGSSGSASLPFLVDAASSNGTRKAKLNVKLIGSSTTTVINGTVGTTDISTLPATPCTPPTIDPYVTLPNIVP